MNKKPRKKHPSTERGARNVKILLLLRHWALKPNVIRSIWPPTGLMTKHKIHSLGPNGTLDKH